MGFDNLAGETGPGRLSERSVRRRLALPGWRFRRTTVGGRRQHGERKPRYLGSGCAAQNCEPTDFRSGTSILAALVAHKHRGSVLRVPFGELGRVDQGDRRQQRASDCGRDLPGRILHGLVGRWKLPATHGENRIFDLWYAKRSEKGFELFPLLETEFTERLAVFSPDGRYFAHCSDESGREEVYVRRFPDGSGKVRVSQNGGCKPQWSRDGKEVFYIEGDALFSVPVNLAGFAVGEPKVLFREVP